MLCFTRKSGEYGVEITAKDVSLVANKVKLVPREYINEAGNNVTKECIEYISPLILGEKTIKYENGMPVHIRLK